MKTELVLYILGVQHLYNPSKSLSEIHIQFGVSMSVNKIYAESPFAIYAMKVINCRPLLDLLSNIADSEHTVIPKH